jgi:hypothetical protein
VSELKCARARIKFNITTEKDERKEVDVGWRSKFTFDIYGG